MRCRSFVTRRWFAIMYRHAFMTRVEVPSATQIESVARMRAQFKRLSDRKQAWLPNQLSNQLTNQPTN